MQILNAAQQDLVNRERTTLLNLHEVLESTGLTPQDSRLLHEALARMEDLFLLVIVGEFNSGKSAFINALLGQKLLREGVTPTTTSVDILRYGPEGGEQVLEKNVRVLTAPVDLLKDISIVDTPGTNAVLREHEQITTHFVPNSDMVLFVTSVDRPFTESERSFLEAVRDWGKKLIIIINKADLIQDEDNRQEILSFVRDNARALLGTTPGVFFLSARQALRAKLGEPALWAGSGFEVLESHLTTTLDETERLRLKLLNPLGVAERLCSTTRRHVEERRALLAEDVETIDAIDGQLGLYKDDMLRDFEFRMAEIEKVLLEMEQRGQVFFEDTLRISRVLDLLKRKQIQQEFEHAVIADVPQKIERKVNDLIDWMVDRDFHQWQTVMDHLRRRKHEHGDRLLGDPGAASYTYTRERLIEAVGKEAAKVVDSYDRTQEAMEIANGAQEAVAATAALEVGAVGLGTLVAVLATTMAADVTGILIASLMAVLGLFVIPGKRRQANREMSEKIAALRGQLAGSLRGQFTGEMQHGVERIQHAISPYTRFVRAENQKLGECALGLEEIQRQVDVLKAEVERL